MKVSTGIENLDYILGGGFLEKSFNLVCGGGGTGKTLFTFNYLLSGAENGRNVLYVSLEETWDDIVRKLPESMKSRLENVRNRFHYLDFGSLRPVLGQEILKGDVLTEAIVSSIVVNNVSLVGLDGIAPLSMYYEDEKKIRGVIFDMSQNLKSYGVTTVFTSEERDGRSRYGVEEFVADAVLRLIYDGKRRRLQVIKTRGSSFIGGYHGFEINEKGLYVYPNRLPRGERVEIKSQSLGIPKLDSMIGEIYSGSVTLVTGPPGSGKYLFGLRFALHACSKGMKSVYVTFEANETKIKKRLAEMVDDSSKLCRIIYINPSKVDIYKLLWKLRELTQDASRLVLHGIDVFQNVEEYGSFVNEFLDYTRSMGISTMITYTTPEIIATKILGDEHVVHHADNIIKLLFAEINGELKKVLVIIKSHIPTHERGLVEYRLGRRGIVIVGKIEELEGIMSGVPTKQIEIKKRVEKFFR